VGRPHRPYHTVGRSAASHLLNPPFSVISSSLPLLSSNIFRYRTRCNFSYLFLYTSTLPPQLPENTALPSSSPFKTPFYPEKPILRRFHLSTSPSVLSYYQRCHRGSEPTSIYIRLPLHSRHEPAASGAIAEGIILLRLLDRSRKRRC
jgi:hypothetical protein